MMRWLQPTLLKLQHMMFGGEPSPTHNNDSSNAADKGRAPELAMRNPEQFAGVGRTTKET
jgi:hypothetical protein